MIVMVNCDLNDEKSVNEGEERRTPEAGIVFTVLFIRTRIAVAHRMTGV